MDVNYIANTILKVFFNELDIDSTDIIRILVLLMTGAYITLSNASQLN